MLFLRLACLASFLRYQYVCPGNALFFLNPTFMACRYARNQRQQARECHARYISTGPGAYDDFFSHALPFLHALLHLLPPILSMDLAFRLQFQFFYSIIGLSRVQTLRPYYAVLSI
jgi:hypothetical protein